LYKQATIRLGVCWGSYVNLRLSGHFKDLKAAVSYHPSHHAIIKHLGEDEKEILQAAKRVPQVYCLRVLLLKAQFQ
jgi:dienelactone hydrolase